MCERQQHMYGVKDCKDGSDEKDCSRSLYVVERCL